MQLAKSLFAHATADAPPPIQLAVAKSEAANPLASLLFRSDARNTTAGDAAGLVQGRPAREIGEAVRAILRGRNAGQDKLDAVETLFDKPVDLGCHAIYLNKPKDGPALFVTPNSNAKGGLKVTTVGGRVDEGYSPIETLRKEACEELHAGSKTPHIFGGAQDEQIVLSIRAASNLEKAEDIADMVEKGKSPYMTTILLVGSRIQDRAMREGLNRSKRNAAGVAAFNKPCFRLVGGKLKSDENLSEHQDAVRKNVQMLSYFFARLKYEQGSLLKKDRSRFEAVLRSPSSDLSRNDMLKLMSRMSELTETSAVGGTTAEEMDDLLATLAEGGKEAVKERGYAPMTIKDLQKHLQSPNYRAFMADEPIETVPMSAGAIEA